MNSGQTPVNGGVSGKTLVKRRYSRMKYVAIGFAAGICFSGAVIMALVAQEKYMDARMSKSWHERNEARILQERNEAKTN